MKAKLVRFIAHELTQQRPGGVFGRVLKVGSADIGQVAMVVRVGLIGDGVTLAVKVAVIGVAPLIHAREQPAEHQGLSRRDLCAARQRSLLQPRQVLPLLARGVTADQRVHAPIAGGDALVKVTEGQVGVVAQGLAKISRGQVPHHQHIAPAGIARRTGGRPQVVERQDFLILDHQQFDTRIVMQEQRAVAAMQRVQGILRHARMAQGRDPQLKRPRRPACKRQLGCAQQRQDIAAAGACAVSYQHLVFTDPLHAACRYHDSLNQ